MNQKYRAVKTFKSSRVLFPFWNFKPFKWEGILLLWAAAWDSSRGRPVDSGRAHSRWSARPRTDCSHRVVVRQRRLVALPKSLETPKRSPHSIRAESRSGLASTTTSSLFSRSSSYNGCTHGLIGHFNKLLEI